MNLVSCDRCGLVYDANKVNIPTDDAIEHACSIGDPNNICIWTGDGYASTFKCHCGNRVVVES